MSIGPIGKATVVGFAALLANLSVPSAKAVPKGALDGRVDAVTHEVDKHQLVYGSVYGYGSKFVFTISNGARVDPLHLNVHFQFIDADGKLLGEVVQFGWCPASKGGSAPRCDGRFSAPATTLFQKAAIIKMYGERVKGPGRPNGPVVTFSQTF